MTALLTALACWAVLGVMFWCFIRGGTRPHPTDSERSDPATDTELEKAWSEFEAARENYWRNDARRDLRTHADLSGESAWDWLCYGAALVLIVATVIVATGGA